MARGATALVISLAVGAAGLPLAYGAEEDRQVLLVVVNLQSPIDDLSSNELRRIYIGERRFWDSRERIVPVLPPRSPATLQQFAEQALQLDVSEFQREWQSRIFRGDAVRAPLSFADGPKTAQAVFGATSAIAIVPSGFVTNLEAVVKVLTIDGRDPDDPEYLLRP